MKASQKLKIDIEGIPLIVKFSDLPDNLKPLAYKLEIEGNLYGPVTTVINNSISLCVTMEYYGERKGPSTKIFGYDAEEFLKKQYR